MNQVRVLTTEDMRRLLRERRRGGEPWRKLLGHDIPPGSCTKREMADAFRSKLRARGDRGLLNLLKNAVLEPRNPFEPDRRRRPKREVVTLALLFAILLGTVCWFNVPVVR